jgi:Leucine-rich repeat (LRR) protein
MAITALGGEVLRDADGSGADGPIVEVSLARTWARDADVARVAGIRSLRRLDLSFTYVTDRGIEQLAQLPQLEELNLDTAEFITDAALSYLRANHTLRKLCLRGTDITDISLPYIATLTGLRRLDLSHTQLGDIGLESLPALTDLEELYLGGTRISGINFNFLKLLPKLRVLRLGGIQRRNGGACWSPLITDRDLDAISMLEGLEELHIGVGLSLGRERLSGSAGNCRVAGGITLTDLGLAKIARLKNLRRLDVSGAKLTPAGLKVLAGMPRLERLSLWNCKAIDDSAAAVLGGLRSLRIVDLSDTAVGDGTLRVLAGLPELRKLYLTDAKVTAEAVTEFRGRKPGVFVSWVRGPEGSR